MELIVLVALVASPLISAYLALYGRIWKSILVVLPLFALAFYFLWQAKFATTGSGEAVGLGLGLIILVPLAVAALIGIPAMAFWGKRTGRF